MSAFIRSVREPRQTAAGWSAHELNESCSIVSSGAELPEHKGDVVA